MQRLQLNSLLLDKRRNEQIKTLLSLHYNHTHTHMMIYQDYAICPSAILLKKAPHTLYSSIIYVIIYTIQHSVCYIASYEMRLDHYRQGKTGLRDTDQLPFAYWFSSVDSCRWDVSAYNNTTIYYMSGTYPC